MPSLAPRPPEGDVTASDFEWTRVLDFEWTKLLEFLRVHAADFEWSSIDDGDWARVIEVLQLRGADFEWTSIQDFEWSRAFPGAGGEPLNPDDHPALDEPPGDLWILPVLPNPDDPSAAISDTGALSLSDHAIVGIGRAVSDGDVGVVLNPDDHPALPEPVPGEPPLYVGAGDGGVSAGGPSWITSQVVQEGWVL